MSKQDVIEVEGTVVEAYPNAMFGVEYVLLGVDVYGRREDFVQIVGSDA